MAIYSRSFIKNTKNWDSGSGKSKALLNQISPQTNNDKMYLYIKDLLFLVNKRENTKYDPKYFIECSDKMKRYL